jgi:urea transport system substrate-binding protein
VRCLHETMRHAPFRRSDVREPGVEALAQALLYRVRDETVPRRQPSNPIPNWRPSMKRRHALRSVSAALAACSALSFTSLTTLAADTIKVGILHSLSGTMAISETVLKDVALMAIEEINAKGGVLGKKLEPVVVDPASNWPLFAEKAKQLIGQDKVAVMFGCWTSVSRKSVLPVVEELNGLLFYPVQYEGEELSKNVFYTGAAPNQQAIPAVEYLMSKDGGGAKRFVLLGTDYVYPRTTNKILRAFLKSKGIADKDIDEKYTPFGHSDYQTIVADVKKFAAGGKTAVISTINGDSNVPFYKELGNQGLKATDVPVVAFSVGEEELRGVDTKPLVGHLAAWNYFMSLKNPTNDAFKKQWADYAKAKKLPGADRPLTNDPMEATYIGIYMWKQAVEKAKSTDTDKVIAAMAGQTFKAPGGMISTMDATNHHLHKPVFIGEVKADGQFNVVWKTAAPVKAKPWSPYIEGNDKKKDEPEKK